MRAPSGWRPEPFVSRRRPRVRPASRCAPLSWPCCSTASIGKAPSAPSAIGGRRRVERVEQAERAADPHDPPFLVPTSEQKRARLHHLVMSLADPAAGLPPTDADQLPDDVGTLKRMVLELLASLHEHRRDNEALRHRLDLLLRRLYGPRGERSNPDQPLLFAEVPAG